MTKHQDDSTDRDPKGVDPNAVPKVDQARRRLSTLGVSGTAVMLSVTSRSAVAGWGTCTGSEIASGNLSRAGDANPCGCSPGFWWNGNGTALWNSAPTLQLNFPRTAKFNKVFGVSFFADDEIELKDVGPSTNLQNQYSGGPSTAMHAVAALLNAQFYGDRYPAPYKTAAAVISAFQAACGGVGPSNQRDALAAFVALVDVYDTPDLWCNGDD